MGTFRDRGGMWASFNPMTLATPEALARDPALVHDLYNQRQRGAIEAHLFVAIGTSGAVYPAADYAARAQALGIRTCELNRAPSDTATGFDEAHDGPATELVPAFVQALSG